MTTFSDDDLKRLKEDPDYWWDSLSKQQKTALLARLEAAEQKADAYKTIWENKDRLDEDFLGNTLERLCSESDGAWRKAAGK